MRLNAPRFFAVFSILAVAAALAAASPPTAIAASLNTVADSEAVNEGKPVDSGISVEVWDALNLLEASASQTFPQQYGGKTLGTSGDPDRIILYLTERDPAVESEFAKLTGLLPAKLEFKTSLLSWLELEKLNQTIQADSGKLRETGIPIASIGIVDGMRVEVVLETKADRSLIEKLQATYGPAVDVVISEGGGIEAGSRVDDSSPWHGGSFLSPPNNARGGCTSGFAMRWPTTKANYVLTAGHCYEQWTQVNNGIANPVFLGGHNSNLVGTVTNRTYGGGLLDAELINTPNATASMWAGGTTTSTLLAVNAIATTYNVGQPACTGGAYEGQYCGHTIHTINGCEWLGGIFNCGADFMTHPNSQAVGSGDSGGPVYATVGGVTYGFGIIKGITWGAAGPATCSNWNSYYQAAQTYRRCSGQSSFTELDLIAAHFNLVLDN